MTAQFSPREVEIFFKGMQHAQEVADRAGRDKGMAIQSEIVTLRLIQHVGKTKPRMIEQLGEVAAVALILGLPFYGSWIFHAMTGQMMQF